MDAAQRRKEAAEKGRRKLDEFRAKKAQQASTKAAPPTVTSQSPPRVQRWGSLRAGRDSALSIHTAEVMPQGAAPC